MSAVPIGSLQDSLGSLLASYDDQESRIATDRANRLRELTAQGVSRRKQLQEGYAARGLIHSGISNDSQTELQGQIDSQKQNVEQFYNDKLANLARERIKAEGAFQIDSIIPR